MGHIETHIIQLTYSHVNLGHSKFHGAHWHTLNTDPGGQFRKANDSPGNRQGILFAHKEWELGIAMFDHFQHYFILSKTVLSFCVLATFFCCIFLSLWKPASPFSVVNAFSRIQTQINMFRISYTLMFVFNHQKFLTCLVFVVCVQWYSQFFLGWLLFRKVVCLVCLFCSICLVIWFDWFVWFLSVFGLIVFGFFCQLAGC